MLLIDEIDALVGDTLLSVLRQLRSGYDQRPAAFPYSIILCGVRDVRDCRIHSTAEDRMVLGGSAFNIKAKSLRLGDFSEQEVRALLAQHTAATGQAFTEEAVRLILTRTAGQPWLVNALCREACFEDQVGRDRSRPITADAILAAQERLILRRDTHIDDLAHKLREERVRRVVEPILTGAAETACSDENLAQGVGADHRRGDGANPSLRRPVRGGGGPPDRVRSHAGPNLGGQDLPPRASGSWRTGHGLGNVAPSSGGTPCRVDFPSTSPAPTRSIPAWRFRSAVLRLSDRFQRIQPCQHQLSAGVASGTIPGSRYSDTPAPYAASLPEESASRLTLRLGSGLQARAGWPTLPPWPALKRRQPGGRRQRKPGAPSCRRSPAASPSACRAPESTASRGGSSIGMRLPRPPGSASRPRPITSGHPVC